MSRRTGRSSRAALVASLLVVGMVDTLAVATEASAQLRFDRGQNVAPVFEG